MNLTLDLPSLEIFHSSFFTMFTLFDEVRISNAKVVTLSLTLLSLIPCDTNQKQG